MFVVDVRWIRNQGKKVMSHAKWIEERRDSPLVTSSELAIIKI